MIPARALTMAIKKTPVPAEYVSLKLNGRDSVGTAAQSSAIDPVVFPDLRYDLRIGTETAFLWSIPNPYFVVHIAL